MRKRAWLFIMMTLVALIGVWLWFSDDLGEEVSFYHESEVFDLEFIPGTDLFVSAQLREPGAQVWDIGRRKVLEKIAPHASSVDVTADGKTVVVGTLDRKVYLWDVATRTTKLFKTIETGSVMSVAISPDGSRIAAGQGSTWHPNFDSTSLERYSVWIWDAKKGELVSSVSDVLDAIYGVDIASDNDRVVFTCANDTLWLWSIGENRILWQAGGKPKHYGFGLVYSKPRVRLFPDETKISWGSKVCETMSGKVLSEFRVPPGQRVLSTEVSPNGLQVLTGAGLGKLFISDANTGALITSHTVTANSAQVNAVAISADGSLVLTGGINRIPGFQAIQKKEWPKDPYVRLWKLPDLPE